MIGCLAVAAIGLLAVRCATAQGVVIPQSGSAVTQSSFGLTITVNSQWFDGSGYRPFVVTVVPAAPVTADRDLLIRISTNSTWYGHHKTSDCEQYLSIPSGTPAGQAITTTVSVPPSPMWVDYSIEIIDPSTATGTVFQYNIGASRNPSTQSYSAISQYPHLLFLDSVPDTTAICDCLPPIQSQPPNYNPYGAMPAAVPPVNAEDSEENSLDDLEASRGLKLPTTFARPMADAPERWIDYTSFDIICLSIDQLAALAQKYPAAHRAVLDWTDSGGNLWITGLSGAEGDWSRLAETDRLLRLPPEDKPPDGYASNLTTSNQAPFYLREYGMGTVTAIPADPFSGNAIWKKRDWRNLLDSIGIGRWKWNLRHGVNLGQGNNDFWNFLIPGVGVAPVMTFQVFITLFVLVIGPLNYWYLRRRKRLHLMVATIPLCAGLVTALLFGYALVADGLGTRLRARSITKLDSRRGTAVTWARLSYYAGIAPSKGLTFSPNTAVYPILDALDSDPMRMGFKKTVWENDQRLVEGWLKSRTPTQYLTIRSHPTSIRLNVIRSADPAAPPTVENKLGVRIADLAIRGGDGQFYYIENLDPDARKQTRKCKAEEIQAWCGKIAGFNRPEFSPEMNPNLVNMNSMQRRRSYSYNYYQFQNVAPVDMSCSLLELYMKRLGGDGSRIVGYRGDEPLLTPNTYIALVAESPEVEKGVDSAREEAGFHIVVGDW
jgi:hypothetical protein